MQEFSLRLLASVYKDCCRMCDAENDNRDLDYIRSRVRHEGDKFLTIALPSLGADLESALSDGHVSADHFRYFKKWVRIPKLFGVFFRRIFDEQGTLLNDPSPNAIWAIRQLAYMFKKRKELTDEKLITQAFERFVEVEQELSRFIPDHERLDEYNTCCRHLWGTLFSDFHHEDIVPKHGPGATAERVSGNRKYVIKRWHERLEPYFPLFGYALPNEGWYDTDDYNKIESVPESEELPVRVIAVPKTAKTPRIIAIEPVCMQYTQQAVAKYMVNKLERGILTGGHINFKDQSVNQRLALQSSNDLRYATIDLSDASDRVLNSWVLQMLSTVPDLSGAVQACRSKRANVDGKIVDLTKFASMGSALCFPIEAMHFFTICVLGVLRSRKLSLDYANIKKCSRHIYVYGDDIIVPTDTASVVLETLTAYGCKVNTAKSFVKGSFRESCGVDAYNGVEVTPIYMRQTTLTKPTEVKKAISWVETANLCFKAGLWLTATTIDSMVSKVIGKLPVTGWDAPGLGLHSFVPVDIYIAQKQWRKSRFNRNLQRVEFNYLHVKPVYKPDLLNGPGALIKCLTVPFTMETSDNHLMQTVRRGAVTLKRRWSGPV